MLTFGLVFDIFSNVLKTTTELMMRKTSIIAHIVIASSIALSGCGGGSSSDGGSTTPTTPPSGTTPPVTSTPTLSLSGPTSIETNEGETRSATIDIDYTGSDSLSVDISSPSIEGMGVDYSVSGGKLTLTLVTPLLVGADKETGTLSVQVGDGEVSDSIDIGITAINTSFSDVINTAISKQDSINNINVSDEISNISIFLADKAYLYGALDNEEKNDWLSDINAQAMTVEDNVKSTLGSVYGDIASNVEGLTESQLLEKIDEAEVIVSDSGSSFAPVIESLNTLSTESLTLPDSLTLTVTESGASLFYGNPSVGSGEVDSWTFHSEFSLLAKLLPTDAPLCIADNNE
tara:strand:- start:290 stop:1330 length:1041 start_codon:yes stop_codon:yes gene_type:complete